jgi:hypothetical protein
MDSTPLNTCQDQGGGGAERQGSSIIRRARACTDTLAAACCRVPATAGAHLVAEEQATGGAHKVLVVDMTRLAGAELEGDEPGTRLAVVQGNAVEALRGRPQHTPGVLSGWICVHAAAQQPQHRRAQRAAAMAGWRTCGLPLHFLASSSTMASTSAFCLSTNLRCRATLATVSTRGVTYLHARTRPGGGGGGGGSNQAQGGHLLAGTCSLDLPQRCQKAVICLSLS